MSARPLYTPEFLDRSGMSVSERKKSEKQTPIEYISDWFRENEFVDKRGVDNRVLVLQSGTGTGKTTVLPVELLNISVKRLLSIAVLQPRVILAKNTSYYVANVLSKSPNVTKPFKELRYGENIGFETGVESFPPERGGIQFMTTDILSNQIYSNELEDFLKKYDIIIVDEIHLLELPVIMLLMKIRDVLLQSFAYPKSPFIVIMSAKFNIQEVVDYFGGGKVVLVTGIPWNGTQFFAPADIGNWTSAVTKIVFDINQRDSVADENVLIFAPTSFDIRNIISSIDGMNKKCALENNGTCDKPLAPIILDAASYYYGQKTFRETTMQSRKISVEILDKQYKAFRKVIVSTPVVEAGLTMHNLRYVIDSGLFNSSEYNPLYDSETFVTRPISKQMAIQRRGRAGRTSEGFYYPLFTEATFESFEENHTTHAQLTDFSMALLSSIVYWQSRFEDVKTRKMQLPLYYKNSVQTPETAFWLGLQQTELIDTPNDDIYCRALQKLYVLNIATVEKITVVGEIISKLSKVQSIETARLIVAGFIHDAPLDYVLIIAAYIEAGVRLRDVDTKFLSTSIKCTAKGVTKERRSRAKEMLDMYQKQREEFDEIVGIESRLWISDALINFVFIHYAFLDAHIDKNIEITAWCESIGASHKTISSAEQMRQSWIVELAELGYYVRPEEDIRLVICRSIAEAEVFVTRLKRCIYDAFRLRLAVYDKAQDMYYLPAFGKYAKVLDVNTLPITTTKKMSPSRQTRPNYIVIPSINVDYSTGLVKSYAVSVLDGWVSPDMSMLTPMPQTKRDEAIKFDTVNRTDVYWLNKLRLYDKINELSSAHVDWPFVNIWRRTDFTEREIELVYNSKRGGYESLDTEAYRQIKIMENKRVSGQRERVVISLSEEFGIDDTYEERAIDTYSKENGDVVSLSSLI